MVSFLALRVRAGGVCACYDIFRFDIILQRMKFIGCKQRLVGQRVCVLYFLFILNFDTVRFTYDRCYRRA